VLPEGLDIRPPTRDDLNWVIKSWTRSYANSPWSGSMSRERQVQAIRGTILDLIQRGAEVSLVCLSARPDFILGFICFEQTPDGPVVHYVYTRHGYRESGIGSAMVESIANNAKIRTSHRTPLGDHLFKGSQYAPRLSRYYTTTGEERERGQEHPDSSGALAQRYGSR
jgi:GNAT superfamily N-acetyltransferase